MEKNTPHYELAVIKAEVRRLGQKAFTKASVKSAEKLGFNLSEMLEIVFELQTRMLYKSMTTYDDHRMAMCFSLVSLRNIPITINDPACVNKTFPTYFEVLESIVKT